MAYRKKLDTQINDALASMPPLDIDTALQAMRSESDCEGLGLPAGYQWIVAMHDAYSKLQEAKMRQQQLESALLSFKDFFDRGVEWPTSKYKGSEL